MKGGKASYTYNGDNQLTKAEHKATSGGPVDLRVQFKYDVLGNRLEKSVDSDGDGPGAAVVSENKGDIHVYYVPPFLAQGDTFLSQVRSRAESLQPQRLPALTAQERGQFIAEWHRRGYATPRGGWEHYDLHHIQPREFGGTHDFWNLVPVERNTE